MIDLPVCSHSRQERMNLPKFTTSAYQGGSTVTYVFEAIQFCMFYIYILHLLKNLVLSKFKTWIFVILIFRSTLRVKNVQLNKKNKN